MDELISRQAAIDTVEHIDWYHLNARGEMVSGANPAEHQAWYKADDIYKALEDLPSAQRWIPCSETVDIPDHEILACDKYGEEMFGYLGYEDEQWMCASEECVMYDPIAWCEKPEPYKERREE